MGALLGSVLLFLLRLTVALQQKKTQPGWSQFQPPLAMAIAHPSYDDTVVDPRVGRYAKSRPGALSLRAKSSGGNSFMVTPARKRAFRRAQHRAMEHGQTMYRGRLHSVQSLQGLRVQMPLPGSGCHTQPAARSAVDRSPPRLRAVTGCTSDANDVMCAWLERQTTLEVIFLQETHFGLGRQSGAVGHPWMDIFLFT